jgi:CheY-like chemotaxis protein
VESVVHEGATFSFVIDVLRDTTFTQREAPNGAWDDRMINGMPAEIENVNFSAFTILVAEDVDVNFEILEALLEPTGVALEWAQNGDEAVRLFESNPERYDLILMDLQMPEKNGFDATCEIRASGFARSRTVPIIAMTANVFQEDIDRCHECGMNAHIGKPLNFAQVVNILKKNLGKPT